MRLPLLPLLLTVTSLSCCHRMLLPRFVLNRGRLEYPLVMENEWQAGQPTSLTMVTRRMTVRLTAKVDFCTRPQYQLECRCSGQLNWTILIIGNGTHCQSGTTFESRLLGRHFDVALSGIRVGTNSSLPTDWTTDLRLRVSCAEGSLLSSSLRMWHLNHLNRRNYRSNSIPRLRRRVLTVEGVDFLLRGLNATEEFTDVDFFDSEAASALRRTPEFLRQKFQLASAVVLNKRHCDDIHSSVAVRLGAQGRPEDSRLPVEFLRHVGVWPDSGRRLRVAVASFANSLRLASAIDRRRVPVAVCSGVVFAVGRPTFESWELVEEFSAQELSSRYSGVSGKSGRCRLAGKLTSVAATLCNGTGPTRLVCPIVCSVGNFADFAFYRNGQRLEGCDENECVVENSVGKMLQLPATLSLRHNSVYRCKLGDAEFQFNVTVVSMPQFLLAPRRRVFGVEGEAFDCECKISYRQLSTVWLIPIILVANDNNTDWLELSVEKFNKIFNASFNLSSSKTNWEMQTRLTVNFVPNFPRKFPRRLVWRTGVSVVEAAKLGVASRYVDEVGVDLWRLRRPLMTDFRFGQPKDCRSGQKCTAESGGRFQVELSPAITRELFEANVTVGAEFLLNRVPLRHLQLTHLSTFDPLINRLTFTVEPFVDNRTLQLMHSARLTPVFNYSYSEGQQELGVRHFRFNVDSSDCRGQCQAVDGCFYSTEFDSDTSLAQLYFYLEFNDFAPVREELGDGEGEGEGEGESRRQWLWPLAGTTAFVLLAFVIASALVVAVATRRRRRGRSRQDGAGNQTEETGSSWTMEFGVNSDC